MCSGSAGNCRQRACSSLALRFNASLQLLHYLNAARWLMSTLHMTAGHAAFYCRAGAGPHHLDLPACAPPSYHVCRRGSTENAAASRQQTPGG